MATTKAARTAVKNDINTLKDDLKVLGAEEKARLREKATAAEARLRAKAAEAETRLREEADVLRERARGYYDTARVRGQEYYDEASERFDEAQRYVVERVQERPLQSTAIALGVGVVLGLLQPERGNVRRAPRLRIGSHAADEGADVVKAAACDPQLAVHGFGRPAASERGRCHDPRAATLAPPTGGKTHLSHAARAGNLITCQRVFSQEVDKLPLLILTEQLLRLTGEYGRFCYCLHRHDIAQWVTKNNPIGLQQGGKSSQGRRLAWLCIRPASAGPSLTTDKISGNFSGAMSAVESTEFLQIYDIFHIVRYDLKTRKQHR